MRTLLASASLLALGSTAVVAADLPMKAAPMVAPVPVFTWTGCYIGGHVGAGAMRDSYTESHGNGAIAGGQIGCNYQDGNAVFGLEGDGSWSGIQGTNASSFVNTGEGGTFTTSRADVAKNKNDFSIAARAGIAFDRTLVYGKAGWVWGSFDFNTTGIGCCFIGPGPFGPFGTFSFSSAQNGTLDGLLLGVGIEHAFARNWTVKLEYNFMDFGSKSLAQTVCLGTTCVANGSFTDHATKQVFKVGFNYLFNNWGAAPVVAKY